MQKNLNIGEKIKYFRNRMGISQFDLELSLGLGSGSLSRIESGKTNPMKETLFHIASILELNPIEIAFLFGIDLSSYISIDLSYNSAI